MYGSGEEAKGYEELQMLLEGDDDEQRETSRLGVPSPEAGFKPDEIDSNRREAGLLYVRVVYD